MNDTELAAGSEIGYTGLQILKVLDTGGYARLFSYNHCGLFGPKGGFKRRLHEHFLFDLGDYVENRGGLYCITEAGRQALAANTP